MDALKTLIKAVIDRPELNLDQDISKNKLEIKPNFYHSITVIVQSLAKLKVRNSKIFTQIALRILSDSAHHQNLPIKPKEAAQILSSYTKVGFYDHKLFRILEDIFIENIENSVVETTANMLLSHIDWAKYIVHSTFTEKGSQKMFNSFKKYHVKFVNLCLSDILNKGTENLGYKATYFIMQMCNLKHLKNRDNARLIYSIGLKGVPKLSEVIQELENQHQQDLEVLKYYSALSQTILNKTMEKDVKDELLKHEIDIEKVIIRVEQVMNQYDIKQGNIV